MKKRERERKKKTYLRLKKLLSRISSSLVPTSSLHRMTLKASFGNLESSAEGGSDVGEVVGRLFANTIGSKRLVGEGEGEGCQSQSSECGQEQRRNMRVELS